MNKQLFYNAPCSVWRGFLDSDGRKTEVLDYHLYCAVSKKYDNLTDIEDEDKRFEEACDNLYCTIGNKCDCLEYGHNLNSSHQKDAIFSVNSATFWDFHHNYKSEEECTLLLAYLALKSIIGTKSYAKTNKEMWLSRMDGKTRVEYSVKKDGSKELVLSKSIMKWNTHYGVRKLKTLLWKYYHVSFYSKSVHGFYASVSLDDKGLVAMVQKVKKEPTLYDEFKKAQIAAVEAVTGAKT